MRPTLGVRGRAVAKPGLEMTLQPQVLRWARERVGYEPGALAGKMGVKPDRVADWEATGRITMPQARNLARRTHTPEGCLYLNEPPDDRMPIADLRTPGDQPLRRPSPGLLDTVYLMQARQEWMREERVIEETEPLGFVGAFPNSADTQEVAAYIRATLKVEADWASKAPTWSRALIMLRNRIEDAGMLVFFNGVVGNNTHRKLDKDEFQGFALVDEYAPVIFVNGADYKAAQMFTLAHELAHIFTGTSGVSLLNPLNQNAAEAEKRCNSIAAEFLVHGDAFRAYWGSVGAQSDRFQAVAREFKVSEIVAARRALEIGLIDRGDYSNFYAAYIERERSQSASRSGGDFWNTQNARLGRVFGPAVARAAMEGRLLYREAYMLTGLNGKTFNEFAKRTVG